jgi:hypothetical protein
MIANKLKKIEYLKFPSLEGRRGGSINKNIQFFEFHRLYGQTLITQIEQNFIPFSVNQ